MIKGPLARFWGGADETILIIIIVGPYCDCLTNVTYLMSPAVIIKGERIEDLLPSENSWNSVNGGLVAVKVGIFFHILVFIVKKVTWRIGDG